MSLLLARNRELRHELERVREERDHWEMAHEALLEQRDSARRFAATAVEGEAWLIERISGVATAAEELPRAAVIAAFRAVLAEHAQHSAGQHEERETRRLLADREGVE